MGPRAPSDAGSKLVMSNTNRILYVLGATSKKAKLLKLILFLPKAFHGGQIIRELAAEFSLFRLIKVMEQLNYASSHDRHKENHKLCDHNSIIKRKEIKQYP